MDVVNDFTKVLKFTSETLFKFIDNFPNYGIETTKREELEDGSLKLGCRYNSNDFGVLIEPVGNGKVDISIYCNEKTIKLENINESDAERKAMEVLQSEIQIDFDNSIESSRRLQVLLQRITSSDEISINLTAINANYDAELAVSNLNILLDNDEFIDNITDEPCCYEITDNGDELDICTIENFEVTDSCNAIIGAAMKIWCNMSVIQWATVGNRLEELHRICDNSRWRLMEEINFFGELSVEIDSKAVNPGFFTSIDNSPFITNDDGAGFTAEFGFELISRMIEQYLSVLEIYYVNFPHDVQNWMDDDIRRWKKDVNYFIKQRLK